MSELRPADFRTFFQAVYGYEPFPWQMRLADKAMADGGCWPDVIDVPTASGKTACLDVAVFSLALQADWPADRLRTAPRRIFFVVDRRVIVDEAYQRACELAKRLLRAVTQGEKGIVREVAERLRHLAIGNANQPPQYPATPGRSNVQSVSDWLRNQPPLACYQMRGGVYRDHAWARTPTQPMIITSTVDQVGSRLLYRGYGVSDFSRPLHAALTANDSLIILDEAHCSEPFSQTMRAIARYRECREPDGKEQFNSAPLHFVMLSATPSSNARDVLRTEQEDDDHLVLGKRIRASKPARLVVADKSQRPELAATAGKRDCPTGAQAAKRVGSASRGRNCESSRHGARGSATPGRELWREG
jgi:CRISPR-associated endonuclease/helicase Cas3